MGMFASRGTAPEAPAFNAARLVPVLESLDINFGTDDDGAHLGDWDNCRLYFEASGESDEILTLRGYWDFRPPVEAFDRVVAVVNDWNVSRRWPRALAVPGEDDRLPIVGADLLLDLEPGISDELLRQQVLCFVSTTLDLFEHMGQAFPEHTGWFNMGAEDEVAPEA